MTHPAETNVAPRLAPRLGRAVAIDLFERAIVCGWYGYFAYRFLMVFLATHNPATLLLVVSEGTVVAFTLFRRFGAISMRPIDWLLAIGGTVAPLCAMPSGGTALVPAMLSVLIMTAGLAFQIWAKLTLRRRFGIVAANRGVQAKGPYRIVRHPMYAGYSINQIGYLLSNASLWNASIYAIAFGFQIARILVEERYLSRDPAYGDLRARVPYRLIPGVF